MMFDTILSFGASFFLALTAGPLGCFLVWRRLSYLGDILAHASILGFFVGTLFKLSSFVTIFMFGSLGALFFWSFLPFFQHKEEAFLSLFSGISIAVALLFMHLYGLSKSDLMVYFVGIYQKLSISESLLTIAFCCSGLVFLWKAMPVLCSWGLVPDMARVEGAPICTLSLFFFVFAFLFVMLALKTMGALLITVLFCLPVLIMECLSKRLSVTLFGSAFVSCLSFVIAFGVWQKTGVPLASLCVLFLTLFLLCSHVGVFLCRQWTQSQSSP